MHTSKMRTACSLPYGGLCLGGLPDRDLPGQRNPTWTKTPQTPPGQRPPGQRPPVLRSPRQRPSDRDPLQTETLPHTLCMGETPPDGDTPLDRDQDPPSHGQTPVKI